MKLLKRGLIIIFFSLFLAVPALAFPEDNPSNLLSGMILLDPGNQNEAWYVFPGDNHRYHLGNPTDVFEVMKNLSLGISNDNFSKIASSAPEKLEGLILIKPEDFGKAYYVNPVDNSLVYMPNAKSAFNLLRQTSISVTNQDLQTIPVGKLVLNDSGQAILREWQYLGWWGEVNKNYVPAMLEPKNKSKRLGYLFATNKVKVLSIKKGDGRTWYQIDGGQYPGAYVNSAFISTIAQPTPEKILAIPAAAKIGDYWIDVNMSKKVLTLYKYDQVVMATYVAIGIKETPTILGTYNVWYKIKKTRMRGSPPIALHAYDLPDVPWAMFYKGSYSVHGTYWHDDFGAQRSSGCTNVTQGDAKYLFDLTGPEIGNADSVHSTVDNPGVVVNNHY
jgi:lipoprotein-anchoring transpeptidase ErfK/SrfK